MLPTPPLALLAALFHGLPAQRPSRGGEHYALKAAVTKGPT